MKRAAVWILVLLLLCAGVAQAEGWREGFGPQKPYSGTPEVDLDAQFGHVMFYPSVGMPPKGACERLYIYLPREDVKLGEGTLYLKTGRDNTVAKIKMSDAELVTQRDISEAELAGLMWGGGTCFEFRLPQSLTVGERYFVNMTKGCLVCDNGLESPEIDGDTAWSFELSDEYGVSRLEYRRAKQGGGYETVTNPQVGDEIRFDLLIGGDAASAAIYCYYDSVDFPTMAYVTSGEVIGTVTALPVYWGVMFIDTWGNVEAQTVFW